MGLDVEYVFQLPSFGAAFSGLMAFFYPPFFGAVFPSLTSVETLIVIARCYNVLVTAQAVLLYGLRQIESAACLRRVSCVYCFVFSVTAGVAFHASHLLSITADGAFRHFYIVWLCMAVPYGILALMGSPTLIRSFMQIHGAVAGSVGIAGILFPGYITETMFASPAGMGNYDTVSRYYGALICGMCLLTQIFCTQDAAPARNAARVGYACMFAASAVVLFMAMFNGSANPTFVKGHWLSDIAGGFSDLMFVGLSMLYAIASVPDVASVDKAKLLAGQ